jgi:hypothetical protein
MMHRRGAGFRVIVAALLAVPVVAFARADQASAVPTNPPTEPLRAIFIEVDGKVRWRADDRAAWKDAEVNDLVSPGAQVRTGLRSRATLRVGRNATVLVDAGTAIEIPTIEREGETLRTLAAVRTGRVDFKVDKVGYANDFKVATPQTTLAVRGTGFAVNSGPLNGVEVVGARTNMINAIELKYVASNIRYFMSGGATSSSSNPDPVKNAWLSTLGPPQIAGLIADPNQLEQAAAQGQAGNNPVNPQQEQQIGAAESEQRADGQQSPLGGLLQLQEGDLSRLRSLAEEIHDVREDSGEALGLAITRQNAIDAAISARVEMGEQVEELVALRDTSVDDLASATSLSQEVDDAIGDEDEQSGEARLVAALDGLGELDDDWQGELRAQAAAIVASVNSLSTQLTASGTAATQSDATFNPLFSTTSDRFSALESASTALEALGNSIDAYQGAVVAALRSGEVGPAAVAQLQRSVEILAEARSRISAALDDLDGAISHMSSIGSIVDDGATLAAALQAVSEGLDLTALLPDLQDEINANVSAIESLRFGAFFAAASAGVAVLESRTEIAASDGGASLVSSTEANGLAEAKNVAIEQVVNLAQAMDGFWNTASGPGAISPKARMEALLAQSATDRTTMATMLAELNGFIELEDEALAAGKLGEMQDLGDLWLDPEQGLMGVADDIDGEMQDALAAVTGANGAAEAQNQVFLDSNYETLMQAAEDLRDSSAAAAARMTQLRDRLLQYQQQYEALVAAGRGGEAGAAQVASARNLLDGALEAYESGIEASQQAAASALTARTNGTRVLLSAASAALANAANLALESQGLREAIQANVDALQGDLQTGQQNFDNAFNGGEGGGGPPG